MVKRAADKAREVTIRRVAMEEEAAVKDGKIRWESVRKVQQVHAGCRPTRPSAVRKEDRELTLGLTEVLQKWHQHFSKLLNQQSEFDKSVIQQMPLMPPYMELDEPPQKRNVRQHWPR